MTRTGTTVGTSPTWRRSTFEVARPMRAATSGRLASFSTKCSRAGARSPASTTTSCYTHRRTSGPAAPVRSVSPEIAGIVSRALDRIRSSRLCQCRRDGVGPRASAPARDDRRGPDDGALRAGGVAALGWARCGRLVVAAGSARSGAGGRAARRAHRGLSICPKRYGSRTRSPR